MREGEHQKAWLKYLWEAMFEENDILEEYFDTKNHKSHYFIISEPEGGRNINSV